MLRENWENLTGPERRELVRKKAAEEKIISQIPIQVEDENYELNGTLKVKEVIVASDFLVQSPKIKEDRKDAYKELRDEAIKKDKSIAKIALTLPKLLDHLDELEARIKKLEKK